MTALSYTPRQRRIDREASSTRDWAIERLVGGKHAVVTTRTYQDVLLRTEGKLTRGGTVLHVHGRRIGPGIYRLELLEQAL